ncbi:hypothetical protein [Spirosoma endbachense]|uniref:Uncharacterized protein n=1 Tax=Spirosoma endbachense TaxID=2666025 RepID=A0A6P1VVF5_9BACT|nr:hypothetical protein [Spirosoma endbachense]QHV95629.1 hypothetical protein GJR95_11710 [Spirosoma endbachense]
MADDFPIPIPGQSLGVSFAKTTRQQRQAIVSLLFMAYATQYPLVETKKATQAGSYLSVAPQSLPAVLASELGVSLEQAHELFGQGPAAVFGLLRSLPLAGRILALLLALFIVAPDSPEEISPITSKLLMIWGLETQVMPDELMPDLVRYGEQVSRFLSGKEFSSN